MKRRTRPQTSDRRLQSRANVRYGCAREGRTVTHGSFMTGLRSPPPARTIADLADDHVDGGHLGRIASDALANGLVTESEVAAALGDRTDIDAILELATGKAR